ncbi:MAG: VTT domain-containing protein [Rubrivivax sp.]|nr:VTT domain-containing protein [Rubrivivax sp.]
MKLELDRKQLLVVLVILALAASLWLSAALNRAFTDALLFSKAFVEAHPVASVLAFVALAAVSAMLVLFSSLVTVPVAVYAWGQAQTLLLLLLGWFIGAMLAYFIGRRFGRSAVVYFVSPAALDHWGQRLVTELNVMSVVLLKLALPSEAPSFALGIVRYPLPKFVLVLVLSELPFGVWAVWLGGALIDDRRAAFVLLLLAGLLGVGIAAGVMLRRHLRG